MATIRSLLSLAILAVAPLASGLEPSELPAILDAPELSFDLEVLSGSASASAAHSVVGGSSLVVRPSYHAGEQKHYFEFELDVLAAGPGRLTMSVRSENCAPGLFNVAGESGYWALPQGAGPGQWHQASFLIQPGADRIAVAISSFQPSADAALYFDDFVFQPGIEIVLEDMPAAGAISLQPAKALYTVGEQVLVTVAPVAGVTVESITEIDKRFGTETNRPASFTLAASKHVTLRARYLQRIAISGLNADVRLQSGFANPAGGASFTAYTIILHDVPGKSLLAFDANMLGGREIRVVANGIEHAAEPPFYRYSTDWGWVSHHVFVEHAAPRLEIQVFGDQIGPDKRYLPFRNISLTQDREIALTTRGRGAASATYQDGPELGATLATVLATPEAGWEFVGWEGFATSASAEMTLVIDAPRRLAAVFAQVFEFGSSRWEFKHDGNALIELAADGKGIRIEPLVSLSTVVLDVVVHGTGEFSAVTYRVDEDGETLYAPSPTFDATRRVGSAPLRIREDFYFDSGAAFEIRDIIVSGGSGYDDVGFRILAPEGAISVSPSKARYFVGDIVSLSVESDWLDRFVGWFGDWHSVESEIEIELNGPLALEALFRVESDAGGTREVASIGTAVMEPDDAAEGIAFHETELLSGQWTEIEIEIDAPVTVALDIDGDPPYLKIDYYVGEALLPAELRTELSGLVYCSIAEGATGPLRVRVSNPGPNEASVSARVAGFFQDTKDWVPFLFQSRVHLEPNTRFLPIGSVVSVEAEATGAASEPFVGWQGRAETARAFSFAVAEGEKTQLYPKYGSNSAIPGITFLPEFSVGWQKLGSDQFVDNQAYEGNVAHSIAMQVQGPGVLLFNHSTPNEAGWTDLQVLVDDEPTLLGEYGVSPDHSLEALVPEGARSVKIVTSLSEYASENQLQPYGEQVSGFALQAGYVVAGAPTQPYAASVEGAATPVFAPGSAVTIVPKHIPAGTFSFWRGDLAGRGQSVSLALDRHIISNGVERLSRSVGDVVTKISDNAIFSAIQDSQQAIDYYIESLSGQTTITFSVPAMRELAFALRYADCPAQVRVDGDLVYSGEPGDIEFGFPVKELPQTITLTLDLDPAEHRQVWVTGVRSSGQFALYGDFGDAQEFIMVEPLKDFYAPGEKVTVKLAGEASSGWVFYDVATFLPNLGLFEWIDAEGKRSFEIEIVSETALLGSVGPMPPRTAGQIVTSHNLGALQTAEKAPDGRSASGFRLADATPGYLRIYCPGARHVDFWINAPVGQEWLFPEALIEGLPIAIEGSGDWQQVSLPVPVGSSYLSAFISYYESNANSFKISQTRQKSGYGIPFIATPGGRIEQTPANGVPSPTSELTLQATPHSGYSFASWGFSNAGLATSFAGTPSDVAILVPAFKKDTVFLDLLGTIVEVTGTAPSRVAGSKTLWFNKSGDAIALEVEGPGRITYSTEHVTQDASLYASLDGAHLYRHRYYPIHGNPNAPEIRIPSGRHILELEYSATTGEARSALHGLSFERGAYLDIRQGIAGGGVSVSPDKRFFQIGESYTLTATPEFDQAFARWAGDIPASTTANPLQRAITNHTSVDARFIYDQTASQGGLDWRVRGDLRDPDRRSGSAIVEGPGYFLFDRGLSESPQFAARVDGLIASPIETHLGKVIPISPGKHSLQIAAAAGAQTFAWGAQYHPGWLFAVTGDAAALEIAPRQSSYLHGAAVSVSLPAQHLRDLVLDATPLEPGESRAYSIRQHTIIHAANMLEIGGGFRTNAAPGQIRFANQGASQPYLTILPQADERTLLEASFEGPGELVIDLFAAEHAHVSLYLEGAFVATIEEGAPRSFALPGGVTTARWIVDWGSVGWQTQPVSFRSIQFAPSTPEPFALWMSEAIPPHLYARGVALGAEDDLDGDGRTNLEERAAGSAPHRFDVSNLAMIAPSSSRPALRFELPASFDLDRVSILHWADRDGLQSWDSAPLQETARQVEAIEGRLRITLPASEVTPAANLFRIAIADP